MIHTKEHNELQNKIFKVIILTGIIFSTVSIIGNILVGYPFVVNIKWIVMGVASLCALLNKSIFFNSYFRLFFALCIILILIPNGWIHSGGNNSNNIAYLFLVMLGISCLFHRSLANVLMLLLILTFFMLFYIEQFYSNVIDYPNKEILFFDTLIQIPLTLIGSYLLLRQFFNIYTKEQEKLNEYSLQLQEANKKLEFLVNRDSLTEIYNRRAFDFRLKEIIKNGEHLKEEIYIILFDIDSFKEINDTYGHHAGDHIICWVASSSHDIINKNSLISRWGGDEFAIIFHGHFDEINMCMKKLNEKMNEIQFDENESITISAGITKICENDTMNKVFKRVDEGLYQSKMQGKNQYTVV